MMNLIGVIIVYYSIRIELWGAAKYQVEIIVPFISLGIILLFNYLNKTSSSIISICLVSLNLISIMYFPNRLIDLNFVPKDEKSRFNRFNKEKIGIIEEVYDYSKANEIIKNNKISKSIFTANNTYGVLPEIMSGFNVKEIIEIKNIRSEMSDLIINYRDLGNLIRLIEGNKKVKTIIIGVTNSQNSEFLENLKITDWDIIKKIENKRFRSLTYILGRDVN